LKQKYKINVTLKLKYKCKYK